MKIVLMIFSLFIVSYLICIFIKKMNNVKRKSIVLNKQNMSRFKYR